MQQPGRHVSVVNAPFVDIPAATSSLVLCRPLDAAAEVVMICILFDFHAGGVAAAPADAPPQASPRVMALAFKQVLDA